MRRWCWIFCICSIITTGAVKGLGSMLKIVESINRKNLRPWGCPWRAKITSPITILLPRFLRLKVINFLMFRNCLLTGVCFLKFILRWKRGREWGERIPSRVPAVSVEVIGVFLSFSQKLYSTTIDKWYISFLESSQKLTHVITVLFSCYLTHWALI